jgi:hypothetical protein
VSDALLRWPGHGSPCPDRADEHRLAADPVAEASYSAKLRTTGYPEP